MRRVNHYQYYYLGMTLRPLHELPEKASLLHISARLQNAESALERLLADPLVPLSVSRPAATNLLNHIQNVTKIWKGGTIEQIAKLSEQTLDFTDHYYITQAISRFEMVFSAELQSAATYVVSRKGIYSTTDLIEHAEELLEEPFRSYLPEQAVIDLREAGRCVAFELATAAGFHIIRGTEAVLRQYYAVVTGKQPKNKMRSWRAYYKQLLKNDVDPKIIAVIDQMRELYRNPIFHPEDTLTPAQATTLLGIAQAAIVMIITDIIERQRAAQPTTSAKALPTSPAGD